MSREEPAADPRSGKQMVTPQQNRRPGRWTNQLAYIWLKLDSIWNHRFAYVFHYPVDAIKLGVPDYYKIILEPMDLSTIKWRLENLYYWSASEVIADFQLMFDNCVKFNRPNEPVYCMGVALQGFCQSKFREMPKVEFEIEPPKRGHRVRTFSKKFEQIKMDRRNTEKLKETPKRERRKTNPTRGRSTNVAKQRKVPAKHKSSRPPPKPRKPSVIDDYSSSSSESSLGSQWKPLSNWLNGVRLKKSNQRLKPSYAGWRHVGVYNAELQHCYAMLSRLWDIARNLECDALLMRIKVAPKWQPFNLACIKIRFNTGKYAGYPEFCSDMELMFHHFQNYATRLCRDELLEDFGLIMQDYKTCQELLSVAFQEVGYSTDHLQRRVPPPAFGPSLSGAAKYKNTQEIGSSPNKRSKPNKDAADDKGEVRLKIVNDSSSMVPSWLSTLSSSSSSDSSEDSDSSVSASSSISNRNYEGGGKTSCIRAGNVMSDHSDNHSYYSYRSDYSYHSDNSFRSFY